MPINMILNSELLGFSEKSGQVMQTGVWGGTPQKKPTPDELPIAIGKGGEEGELRLIFDLLITLLA